MFRCVTAIRPASSVALAVVCPPLLSPSHAPQSSPLLLTAARRSFGLTSAIRLAAKPTPALSLANLAAAASRRVQWMGAQTTLATQAKSTRQLHSAIGVTPMLGAQSPLPVNSRLVALIVLGSREFHCNGRSANVQAPGSEAKFTPRPFRSWRSLLLGLASGLGFPLLVHLWLTSPSGIAWLAQRDDATSSSTAAPSGGTRRICPV